MKVVEMSLVMFAILIILGGALLAIGGKDD
jgi:hypothetical protein